MRKRQFSLGRTPVWVVLLAVTLAVAGCVGISAPVPMPAPQAGTPPPAEQAVQQPDATSAAAPPAAAIKDIPMGVDAEGNFYRGDPNAPVKLVEWSEFQCPYCARHVLQTDPLIIQTYIATGQVQHTFRHFPLDFHQNAMPAALATYCAGQQDPLYFWELHDWLFENQAAWSEATDGADQFKKQALALGVAEADYDKCIQDPASTARIEAELQEGMMLGVQGTPAFFVNEWFISGAVGFDEFKDKIEKARAGQKPPPTPTPLPAGAEFWQPDPQRAGREYGGGYYLGEATAPIVVLAFEDFKNLDSAEHLKSAEPTLKSDYIDKGQLRYSVQLFPVTAPRAAAAVICAGQQDKFWEFREQLYTKQAEWTEGDDAAMQGFAKGLGLDEAAFGTCLASDEIKNQVDQALSFAQSDVGVPSAPAYLIIKLDAQGMFENAKGYPGALPLDQFEQAIEEISAPPTPTPTPAPSISKADLSNMPMGRDAEGNFYRGDPNAAVKLVDYSDFQ